MALCARITRGSIAAPVAVALALRTPPAALNRLSWSAASVSVRHFGLINKLKAGVMAGFTEKTEEKKKELFMWQLTELSNLGTYTLVDHSNLLNALAEKTGAVGGWKSALRTAAQQAEIDEQVGDTS